MLATFVPERVIVTWITGSWAPLVARNLAGFSVFFVFFFEKRRKNHERYNRDVGRA